MIFIAVLLLIFAFISVKWSVKIDLFIRLKDYNECVIRISLFFIEIFRQDLFENEDKEENKDADDEGRVFFDLLKSNLLKIVEIRYFAYNMTVGIKDNALKAAILSASVFGLFDSIATILQNTKLTEIKKKTKTKYDESVFILASRGIIKLSIADVIFCIVNAFFDKNTIQQGEQR